MNTIGGLGPALTQFEVGAGLAALVGVQHQEAHLEEEAVGGHVETTHPVEAVAAHHQRDHPDPFAHHVDVVDDPVDRCGEGGGGGGGGGREGGETKQSRRMLYPVFLKMHVFFSHEGEKHNITCTHTHARRRLPNSLKQK